MSVKDWEIACPKCGSTTPRQRLTCISCDAPLGHLYDVPKTTSLLRNPFKAVTEAWREVEKDLEAEKRQAWEDSERQTREGWERLAEHLRSLGAEVSSVEFVGQKGVDWPSMG